MGRRLAAAHKASIHAKLHTIGLSNAQIARDEGITERYVRELRKKEAIFGTPWPETRTPQNATKLIPAAEKALLELLTETPDLPTKDQQDFLLKEFNVKVSPETIRRHLKHANFVKPRLPGGPKRRAAGHRPQEISSGTGTSHSTSDQQARQSQSQSAASPGLQPGPSSYQPNNLPEPRLVPILDHQESLQHQNLQSIPPRPSGQQQHQHQHQTQPRPSLPVSIHTERHLHGARYLASNSPSLISLPFISSAYADRSGGVYWTTPLDPSTISLMVSHSSIMAIYHVRNNNNHIRLSSIQPHHLQQVGMARFITDHVTHAYLTDVYVAPEWRRRGLGTWLMQLCDEFISGIPTLRKTMLSTSNPRRNAAFYQRMLGFEVPEQDADRHLIMVRPGPGGGAKRYSTREEREVGLLRFDGGRDGYPSRLDFRGQQGNFSSG